MKRILLADPDSDLRFLIRVMLKKAGYEVDYEMPESISGAERLQK